MMTRATWAEVLSHLDNAHILIRTLASRLDLPGALRMRLHRIADALLGLMLEWKGERQ